MSRIKSFVIVATLLLAACPLHAASAALIMANQQKLNTIVLPDLKFKDLTVRQAIDQLSKFINLQPGQPGGVNFVLQAPDNAPLITLAMKTPTLGQALAEIAKQAHLQIVPQQYCIAIMPEQPVSAPATSHYP